MTAGAWLTPGETVDSPCLLWPGSIATTGGYPLAQVGNRQVRVHRLIVEAVIGERLPSSIFVAHVCDTPACIRPDHLRRATHDANMADMVAKGRWTPRESSGNKRLTQADVEEIRRRFRHRNTGRPNVAELSEEFGIGRSQVYRIVRRESWKN